MNINQYRLSSQLLTNPKSNVSEIVKHMTCIQSQNFGQSIWAIASRGENISQQDIYNAYNTGQIIRTWTQRGTIHTVAAEDAGWILELCASKTLSGFERRRNRLGIHNEVIYAIDIIKKELKGRSMSRAQIVQTIKDNGISIESSRAYHIICYAATMGIIARGPIVNNEQEYVLLDERVKNPRKLSGDEALSELTLRYFTSHGSATIQDFARWSGLGITQIKKGIELCGNKLYIYHRDGLTYYYGEISQDNLKQAKEGIFLAGFDEFLLGYKDRTDTLHIDHHTLVDPARNGIFRPTVMIDGIHIGTRSTKSTKKQNNIYIKPFENISNQEIEILKKGIYKYNKFTNIDWNIEIIAK